MPHSIELDTSRLHLRQWQPEDFAPFANMNADPTVMAHFPATLDRAASDAMASRCQSLIAERGWGLWALEEKSSGNFIGFTGLHIPQADLPFSPCIEIGWRLASTYWGNGYATEAAQKALQTGFDTLGFSEIVSFTALGNQKSRAVMERLDMQQDPHSFEHPAIPECNPLRKHCLYRLTKAQWQEQQH
ncbi:GNAT family N-acetyltransferase [Kistimonas asteriae]|uniref:GNAT family N-acetyltransferase n=1 Tax=Kistimonas asteriae TaxID=517724 RepID=UPI001BA4979B|nr:GNAT family N-acetyltransferase [Kistimonas asteriae]